MYVYSSIKSIAEQPWVYADFNKQRNFFILMEKNKKKRVTFYKGHNKQKNSVVIPSEGTRF